MTMTDTNEALEALLDDAFGYVTDITTEIRNEQSDEYSMSIDMVLTDLRKLALTLESALEEMEDAD